MKVLNYDVAAEQSGVVRRTFERLISRGEGPPIVEISPRRRGVIDVDLEAWLLKRRRLPPGDGAEGAFARRDGERGVAHRLLVHSVLDAERPDAPREDEQTRSFSKVPRRRAARGE